MRPAEGAGPPHELAHLVSTQFMNVSYPVVPAENFAVHVSLQPAS